MESKLIPEFPGINKLNDGDGTTFLHRAETYEEIKELLENGADPNIYNPNDLKGTKLKMICANSQETDRLKKIQILLDYGADTNLTYPMYDVDSKYVNMSKYLYVHPPVFKNFQEYKLTVNPKQIYFREHDYKEEMEELSETLINGYIKKTVIHVL